MPAEAGNPTALLEAMLALRAALDVEGGEDGRAGRRTGRLKSEVVLALQEGSVMLAMAGDGPLVGLGMASRALVGFTDDEAHAAWEAHRPPGATPLSPPHRLPGRATDLGAVFERGAITRLLVNPAGPACVAVHADEYRDARTRIRRRRSQAGHPWLEPAGRAGPRLAVAALQGDIEAARAEGRMADLEALVPRFSESVAFGDLVGNGVLQDELAATMEARGGSPSDVAWGYLTRACRWGDLGDTERCAAQLVTTARVLAWNLDTGATPDTADARRALAGVIGYLDQVGAGAPPVGADEVRAVATRWLPEGPSGPLSGRSAP